MIDVYYTNTSPIPHELHELQALRNRVSLRFHLGYMADSLEAQRAIFEKCDMLIVQDFSLPGVNPNLPGEKIQACVTKGSPSRSEIRCLAREIPVSDKKRIYVLRNRESLVARQ